MAVSTWLYLYTLLSIIVAVAHSHRLLLLLFTLFRSCNSGILYNYSQNCPKIITNILWLLLFTFIFKNLKNKNLLILFFWIIFYYIFIYLVTMVPQPGFPSSCLYPSAVTPDRTIGGFILSLTLNSMKPLISL